MSEKTGIISLLNPSLSTVVRITTVLIWKIKPPFAIILYNKGVGTESQKSKRWHLKCIRFIIYMDRYSQRRHIFYMRVNF